MPHLVILYSGNLEPAVDMTAVCRALADAMRKVKDEDGKAVFPIGGIRVLAYPAAHHAVADDGAAGLEGGESGDYGFVYLNLRIGGGRSAAVIQAAGDAITAVARSQLGSLLEARRVGMTFQVDIGREAYDVKFGNLHALFQQGEK
ncbi:5-carboxymethyl-2-hydroxymuconate isomerase [Achromobacter kerstersii]|uniref:5-carboxymethyl-2-hydroxymuconate Delta-isomerase n=1 Tax=Achromobacter kerstersii TaxID=1353890 RepID=A0A6S7ABZ8_9BURK|nr:5-carboxymethyl-2-hydroxymuconate isomerase [Achromobacter kerstersii]CAB3663747.1 5-carboxymethyl-2-hydroxymuconate Delta-isomerase [Achromobacter kerstersii]